MSEEIKQEELQELNRGFDEQGDDQIECPFCMHIYSMCHDDGTYYEDGETGEEECPECNKTFEVRISTMHQYFATARIRCADIGKACQFEVTERQIGNGKE